MALVRWVGGQAGILLHQESTSDTTDTNCGIHQKTNCTLQGSGQETEWSSFIFKERGEEITLTPFPPKHGLVTRIPCATDNQVEIKIFSSDKTEQERLPTHQVRDLWSGYRVNCKHTSANKACLRETDSPPPHTWEAHRCSADMPLTVPRRQQLHKRCKPTYPKGFETTLQRRMRQLLALIYKLSSRYKGKNAPHGEPAVGEQNPDGCIYTTSQPLIQSPWLLSTSVVVLPAGTGMAPPLHCRFLLLVYVKS